MQTKRDQLQAYRYMIKRVMTSLLGAEPEAPEQPMKRVLAGTMSGILIAVVAGGIVGAVGFFTKKGATGWQEPGTLVTEKETGTTYAYLDDKMLHPVANYTSALLLVGPDNKPKRASRKDLAEVRVGPQIGILGAPSSLPDADAITSTPWTACSTLRESTDGSDPTNRVDLLIGADSGSVGARDLGRQSMVVTPASDSDATYLLWNNKKYATSDSALRSLSMTTGQAVDPVQVDDAVLTTIPTGPDLQAPDVPGAGQPADITVGGQQVSNGDVVVAKTVGGEESFYVVLADGLAPIHQTEALLLSGQRSNTHEVTAADVNATKASTQRIQQDLPATPPTLTDLASGSTTPVCSWADNAAAKRDHARITVGGTVPDGTTSKQAGSTPSTRTADRVWMRPGSTALVDVIPGPGLDPSEHVLVSSAGVRFPIPAKKETLKQLGFDEVDRGTVSARYVDLLPTGPALDERNAKKPTGSK